MPRGKRRMWRVLAWVPASFREANDGEKYVETFFFARGKRDLQKIVGERYCLIFGIDPDKEIAPGETARDNWPISGARPATDEEDAEQMLKAVRAPRHKEEA